MSSAIADILVLDSPTADGISPPSSPFPSKNTKMVHFQDKHSEISIESLDVWTEADKAKIWFTETEIEGFKVRARALCEDIKLKVATTEENTRGLELRLCGARQRRKYMILQAIIKAQRRYKDPKQLSNIARRCTVWSKAVAAIVAQRDYCDLYDPARIASLAAFPALDDYPLPFKTKGACSIPVKRPISPVPLQRRVRPRPPPFATPC